MKQVNSLGEFKNFKQNMEEEKQFSFYSSRFLAKTPILCNKRGITGGKQI